MPETSSFSVRAELSGLRKDLQEAGDLTEGQAEAMVISLERRLKAAERAAKATTKAQTDAAKASQDWNKRLANLQQVSASLPGPLAGIASTAANASKGLGELAGAAGASATAVGIGVAAFAALTVGMVKGAGAVDDFVASADQAHERLEKLGAAKGIPAASIASIEQYERSSRAAGAAADELRVEVGGLVAGAFEPMISSVAGLLVKLDEFLPTVGAVVDEIETWQSVARVANGIITLGASELVRYVTGLDDLADAGREAAAELEALARTQELLNKHLAAAEKVAQIQADAILHMTGASDATKRLLAETEAIDQATAEYVATLDRTIPEQAALAEAAERSAEVRKAQLATEVELEEQERRLAEATRAEAEASREAAAERARLLAINDQEIDQLEEARQKRADATNAQIEAIGAAREQRETTDAAVASLEDMNEVLADLAGRFEDWQGSWGHATAIVEQAAEQMGKALNSELVKAIEEIGAGVGTLLEDHVSQLEEIGTLQVENARETADAWKAAQESQIEGALESGRLSETEAAQRLLEIEREHEARLEAAEQESKDEEERALKAFKVNQSLQLAQAAIDAARAAVALIPSFLFMGPFAPAGAAAAAGAAFAVQAGIIMSQEPPSFPTGGLVQPDHMLIGAQAGEFVSNRRAVERHLPELERWNRGLDAGGTTVVVQLGRRTLATAIADAGRAQLDPRAGTRDPFGRGRR